MNEGIMSLNQHITLRPSQAYLFSYIWLAGELFVANSLIYSYFPAYSLFALTLCMGLFARLYHWLDFSPESGFQIVFILGLIPLNWHIHQFGFSDHTPRVLLLYLAVFITLGSIRIFRTNYYITHSHVIIQLVRSKSYELDPSRPIQLHQHSRGKLLNFGCVLVPIIESKHPKRHALHAFFFHKRHSATFSRFLRLDGISNPEEVVHDIKNKFNVENI